MKSKIFLVLSFLAIIIGVISWLIAIPNADNSLGTLWMLTFVINPIGTIFGVLSLKQGNALPKIAIILNLLLTFSVGPMWFLGDYFGF
jgi:hypothetical protein